MGIFNEMLIHGLLIFSSVVSWIQDSWVKPLRNDLTVVCIWWHWTNNFMELRLSWKDASCAATQEFNAYIHVHMSLPPVPILSQINPV
jgi:hypothetical protein